jgi:Mn2+/Fe2+ NRAMP family transporter
MVFDSHLGAQQQCNTILICIDAMPVLFCVSQPSSTINLSIVIVCLQLSIIVCLFVCQYNNNKKKIEPSNTLVTLAIGVKNHFFFAE